MRRRVRLQRERLDRLWLLIPSGEGAEKEGERDPNAVSDKGNNYQQNKEDDQNGDENFHASQMVELDRALRKQGLEQNAHSRELVIRRGELYSSLPKFDSFSVRHSLLKGISCDFADRVPAGIRPIHEITRSFTKFAREIRDCDPADGRPGRYRSRF